MVEIRIALFGTLSLHVGEQPTGLRGPQARAVLAQLALAKGDIVSTDRLIDDIWAGEPPPKALGGLQVHVSNLRRALEPDRERRAPARVLVSAAPGYALQLPEDAVDVWRFEALVRDAGATDDLATRSRLLRAALEESSAPVLPEFTDAGWAAPSITRLVALRAAAFELYAATGLDLGWHTALIPELERHLAAEPLSEEAVRLLAIALYRAGRQGDALARLRTIRRRLIDELGVDPGPALRAVEDQILAQDDALLPEPPRDSAPSRDCVPTRVVGPSIPVDGGPPPRTERERAAVVGRSAQLARIETAARTVIAEGLRTVWVGADAGLGKTTLIEAAAQRLLAGGWVITRGRCPEVDGAPPAWAWTQVLQGLTEAPPSGEPHLQAGSAFELAVAVGSQLRSAADGGPVLVVLDDLHRADGATLQILRTLAQDLLGQPVLILGAHRGPESGPDLAATWAALASVTVDRLELDGLDRDGVVALMSKHAPEIGHEPDVVDTVIARTGGNPLFVIEFARLLNSEGHGAIAVAIPTGVREVLRRRLSRLPGPTRTVLQQAAVLGREADVEVLLRIARHDEDEVLDGLEAAVLSGLLDEPDPAHVRFTHALVRDTLYEETPRLRRARWHASALAELRSVPGSDVVALAHHALNAATPATATDAAALAFRAASHTMSLNAPAEAMRLAEEAVRMVELAPSVSIEDHVNILILLTRAAAQSGAVAKARPARLRAVELATAAGDDALLLAALTAYRAPISWTVREFGADDTGIEGPLRRALAADHEADPVTRVWLLVSLIFETENDAALHGFDELFEWAERALQIARDCGDATAVCAALNACTYLSLGPDRADQRDELAAELLAVAQDNGLLGYEALAHWFLFMCASARTDLTVAIRQADLAVEKSTTGQLVALVQVVEAYRAVLYVLAGRYDDAAQRYRRLARWMAAAGMAGAAESAVMFEVVLAFARDDMASLTDTMIAMHDVLPDVLTEVLVLSLLDAGRTDEAHRRWAGRAPVRRNYYWLARMALYARAAVGVGDLDECAHIYAELLPWRGRVAGIDSGSATFGLIDDVLALLADALGGVDAMRHRADADAVRRRLSRDLEGAGIIPRSPSPDGGTSA